MVLFVVALCTALLFGIFSTAKARSDISGTWSRTGPGRIADNLRSRNRVVVGVVTAILVGIALLEAIIPQFHAVMLEFQYAVGAYLNATPIAVLSLGTGGGISWGLYLAILISALFGTLIGVKAACAAYGTTQGISWGQLI